MDPFLTLNVATFKNILYPAIVWKYFIFVISMEIIIIMTLFGKRSIQVNKYYNTNKVQR
jgi:hypothetical protein